jgi:DNA transformation protein
MPQPSQFVAHVIETLRIFGRVEARPMFGGWGLYHDGTFFALIAADALYLKVDDENRPQFDARGLGPFVYESKVGERIVMHYHAVPEEALEDAEVMAVWARSAYGAALRAAAAKKVTKPRAPRGAATTEATPPSTPRKG